MLDFATYVRLARTAERGVFDFVLLADGALPEREPGAADGAAGEAGADASGYRGAGPYSLPVGGPEPVTVLNALASVTERIGLAAVPGPGSEPYDLARGLAALDRLSGGRAGGPATAVPDFIVPGSPQGRPVAIRYAVGGRACEGTAGGGAGGGTGGADADVVVVDLAGDAAGEGAREQGGPGTRLLARLGHAFTPPGREAAAALAERLDSAVQTGAVDGYLLCPEPLPGGRGLDAFVELVVPLLQGRGSLGTAYRGTTLREHLGLRRPKRTR
jgi:alkanesulfonate monooxygenase SsuD/methylene tetrahydromethanopterin reductase-like flavin-dependent oxidoreductase (luciferase family)